MNTRIISNESDKSRLDSSLRHRARYRLASRVSSDTKLPPIKLVIVYEGMTGLMRAKEMWFRLAAHFAGQIVMETCTWNFALLRGTRLRDQAALQAAEANIIVISPGGANELPEHISNWIKTAAPHNGGDAGISDGSTRRSRLLRDVLRRLAAQGNLGVFWNPRNRQTRNPFSL